MAITQFRNASTEELLLQFEGKRQHSPIIDELCNRLEQKEDEDEAANCNTRVKCPVCMAQLEVEMNIANECAMFVSNDKILGG